MYPKWESNQLVPYLKEFNMVASSTRGAPVLGAPYTTWYAANYGGATNYAGMSTAPATDGTPQPAAADTSAGDVAADAGFGGQA